MPVEKPIGWSDLTTERAEDGSAAVRTTVAGADGTPVEVSEDGAALFALRPDLQVGVNKHLEYTILLASTDYTIEIPNGARYLTLYSGSNAFRYAIGEAIPALATGSGNVAAASWGVGGRLPVAGLAVTHILPEGDGRVLHVRSTVGPTVIQLVAS
jgi:hypothetical protein